MSNAVRLPNYPQPGMPVNADWGRNVIDYMRSITPQPGKGARLRRSINGTFIDTTPGKSEVSSVMSAIGSWAVRWETHETDGRETDNGEWQVYAPRGSLTVKYGSENVVKRQYDGMLTNDKATDAEDNEIYQWFAIDDPQDEEADIEEVGGYVAKTWSVHLLIKPWSIAYVSTDATENEPYAWEVTIATIYEIRWTDGESERVSHGVIQHFTGNVTRIWNTVSAFAIDYELDNESSPTSAYTVKVINQQQMVGRLQEENVDPVNVKDASTVWLKIEHDGEDFVMSIKKDPNDPLTNDDQTMIKLYEMTGNVVTRDTRSEIGTLPFYTNAPDDGNDNVNA